MKRRDKSTGVRPARHPTRTLIAGLLWIVFMLVVWFQSPGIRLPTFFQRLVAIVAALLTMLVVMFAIREYGKRFNRVPLPLLGRVSTSRIAGGFVFIAVVAWWMSPWAPIPAEEPEPDLWRLLEQGVDLPLLQVVDTNLATLAAPTPSAEAQQAADAFAATANSARANNPLRSALVAIALKKFDEAKLLLNKLPPAPATDLSAQARAQLDFYRGHYAAAASRYGEMLKVQPRREDFLAHGAMAAALAGDFPTAAGWARQLLQQARSRGRASPRSVEAANLLAVIAVLSGDYAKAQRAGEGLRIPDADRNLSPRDSIDSADAQDAAATNNVAVIRLLAGSVDPGNPSPSSSFALAKDLWLNRPEEHWKSGDSSDPHIAIERSNLAAAALQESRYGSADTLLAESLAAWRKLSGSPARVGLAINLNALAQLARIEGHYASAESWAAQAAEAFAAATADDPSVFASQATIAMLEASKGRYDQAVDGMQKIIHEAGAGRQLSPQHPYIATLKLRLAAALLSAGRNAEARDAADEASTILEHAGLATSRSAAEARRISGLAALRQGNREQAERQLDRARKLLGPTDETEHPQPPSLELAALQAAQGELAGDLQNYTAASDDYHGALNQLAQLFPNQAAAHPLRAEYLHALAELFVKEDKPAEAKPLLEESLAIDRQALPASHPATARVMQDLASVLEQTGSKQNAEKLKAELRKMQK